MKSFFQGIISASLMVLLIPVGVAWAAGGTVGTIVAGIDRNWADVTMSVAIPGYGAYYTIRHFFFSPEPPTTEDRMSEFISLVNLLIHEAQQGCRDATYEPSRFPVAVPYPSPHRATPAYVVVTSSDLDTSRNKASVRGLSWISRLVNAGPVYDRDCVELGGVPETNPQHLQSTEPTMIDVDGEEFPVLQKDRVTYVIYGWPTENPPHIAVGLCGFHDD